MGSKVLHHSDVTGSGLLTVEMLNLNYFKVKLKPPTTYILQ